MDRAGFARARTFLNYHPVAKWSALAAAVGTAVLYVALLLLLALFVDLIVDRGDLPAYASLTTQDQRSFARNWTEPLAHFPGVAWDDFLRANDLENDKPHWQAIRKDWEKQLKDLGQKEDERYLTALLGLRHALTELGVEETRVDDLVLICLADPDKLKPAQQDQRLATLWRVHGDLALQSRVGYSASNLYRKKFRDQVERVGTDLALTRDLRDVGILSLVVRIYYRLDGWVPGWLASWNHWMWEYGSIIYLTGLLLGAVLIAVVRGLLMFLSNYMAAQATIAASMRLRRAVYHHTYRLGTLAFKALGPSEAVSVSTRHLEVVHEALFTWLTVVFREPVKFALLLVFALFVNFWLALAFLLFAVLVWLVGGQIAAYFRRQGRIAGHLAGEQLTLVQESLMLMRLVKVYLMELFNQSRVERQLSKLAAAQRVRYRGEAIYVPTMVFLGLLATLILLFVAGIVVLEGQLGITSFLVLATALVSLYWPATTWLENRKVLRRGRESAVVLFKFLDRQGSVSQDLEAEFLPPLAKSLEFDNVTFAEPGTGRKLLQGITLTIQAGQRVAIVGPEEMEKHALVYLMSRFLDPNSGEIRIDRKNLRWVTFDSLRAQIAMVLQHNLVFNDTVANNIGCGDPSYTLPKIIEAAKIAHAAHFIQKLPQGYETPIGELGHSLKIGEQFRIALARAILRDPALLIIEEPLTPLDDDTKAMLDDTFARVLPGKTVIFLPHRLSTIRGCDKVFLLYQGKIEATGDHKELLAQNDLYRHLQYLAFNEFAGAVSSTHVTAREE